MKYKIGITYGTFDLFHIGHLNLLKRAKAMCDYLIVGVCDDYCNSLKNKHAIIPYDARKTIVESIKYVDEVICSHDIENRFNEIKLHKCDVIFVGNDWRGKFDHYKELCDVVYFDRTEGVSSTKLRNLLDSNVT